MQHTHTHTHLHTHTHSHSLTHSPPMTPYVRMTSSRLGANVQSTNPLAANRAPPIVTARQPYAFASADATGPAQ